MENGDLLSWRQASERRWSSWSTRPRMSASRRDGERWSNSHPWPAASNEEEVVDHAMEGIPDTRGNHRIEGRRPSSWPRDGRYHRTHIAVFTNGGTLNQVWFVVLGMHWQCTYFSYNYVLTGLLHRMRWNLNTDRFVTVVRPKQPIMQILPYLILNTMWRKTGCYNLRPVCIYLYSWVLFSINWIVIRV
jgi:hypothetical protein